MANFNFNEFKRTRVAKTVNGANAKFICETRGKMLVEISPLSYGQPYMVKYNLDGKRYSGTNHHEDLTN